MPPAAGYACSRVCGVTFFDPPHELLKYRDPAVQAVCTENTAEGKDRCHAALAWFAALSVIVCSVSGWEQRHESVLNRPSDLPNIISNTRLVRNVRHAQSVKTSQLPRCRRISSHFGGRGGEHAVNIRSPVDMVKLLQLL